MKLDLKGHLDEIRDFQEQEAYDRIAKWYRSEKSERENITSLDRPPHRFAAERAAHLITYALELWDDRDQVIFDEPPPVAETRDILLLVGAETLLTGIAMKRDTDWFIGLCKNTGGTPSFGQILNDKVPHWIDDLPEEQRDRVLTVLQILKEHRNNLVHFGFHRMRHNPDYPAYYDVLAYFFLEFFDLELPVVEELRNRADRIQKIHPQTDYQWLAFDF